MRASALLAAQGLLAISAMAVAVAASGGAAGDQFQAAYQKAIAVERRAMAQHCAWTVTETALSQAKAAADRGDLTRALALARRARQLAELSLAQAAQQRRAWRVAVIK